MCEEVQLWCAATNVVVDPGTLTPDEHLRASRFRFEGDRTRWMAARVFLRRILSEYLGCAPANIELIYSEQGKPMLRQQNVHFNLSHSGDIAVCAIAQSADIGVDVERIRAIDNMDGMFRSISCAREYSAFCSLPPPDKLRAFFDTWTMKEACVKALGTGLSTPLAEVDPARSCSVVSFNPQPGYAGALALSPRISDSVQPRIAYRLAAL